MSRNLVNGDSLKKYHIGVNTPNISEELINENVTSFKVGTSSVNGVDLSNQMEQSLVDITYIKGKTVKENSKLNSVKVVFDSGEKELHSLQDRFYDEYKDGKLHKRVKKITPKDFEVIHIHSGSEHSWNNNSDTYSFVFNFVGGDCIDESVLACSALDVISYSDLTNGTRTGIFLSREWAWIGFRVDNDTIGVSNSDIDSQKLEKAKKWFFNSNIEIHYLVNEIITNESITILANPNEEINVVSGTPTTIKHTVQLNTKAQVEETQKQIVKSNKSIWQKFKELTEKFKEFTDVEMKLEEHGYIKFPTAFGGLILQWGSFHIVGANDANWFGQDVMFPKPMSKLFTIQCSVDSLRTRDASKGVKAFVERENTSTIGTKFITYVPDNTSTTLRWFVIGR